MFRFNFSISIEFGNNKLASQTTTTSWNRLRNLIKKHHGDICHYCGSYAPNGQADHVLPLAKGGTDAVDNLVWSCERCNQSKGDKTVEEWIQTKEVKAVSEVDIGDKDLKILLLDAQGESYRAIAEEVWGEGKFGGFYNDKIREALEKGNNRLSQQTEEDEVMDL